MREPRCTIDFETRSACDIKKQGAWLYSKHPSTQALFLSYRLPHWPKGQVKRWQRAFPRIGWEETPLPLDLFEYIATGGLVEAHNSFFEMCIWMNVCSAMGWPPVAFEQWRCSASKAAAHALPRDLDGATAALGLPHRKNPEGKLLIRKYSIPAKLSKKERDAFGPDFIFFNEDAEGLTKFANYCDDDVLAEEGLSEEVPDLSPMELRIWQITQRMNLRGVMIDRDLCEAALTLAKEAKAKANCELLDLTGIESGTQRVRIKEWLADSELLELTDTTSKTIDWYLEREEMSERARRVITLMKEINRTSTNKYLRMLQCIDTDDRARDNFLFCGAERTGRYAGKNIQLQNLPKGNFEKAFKAFCKKLKLGAMDVACEDIKSRDLEWCEGIHGDVMNLLASCLRGAIIAPPGRDLVIADYSAIEARCVLWESGATAALEVFRRGEDIYCDMASGIYGRLITKKTAKAINALGATERDFGKVAVLGLGYGMGFLKFLITLRTYNIVLTREQVLEMMGEKKLLKYERIVHRKLFPTREDFDDTAEGLKKFKAASREASLARRALSDEREEPEKVLHELALCKYTVETYRKRYAEVPKMWKDQEAAAIKAVMNPGDWIKCGVVTWYVEGRFLKCELPSGRCLHYCDPEIKMAKTSWGEKRPGLRFWGIDQKTKAWTRQGTYGGKLTENITQAIARDVMAFAMLVLDDHPLFDLILTVHDELGAEADSVDNKAAEEFQTNEFRDLMMTNLPEMAFAGCPIDAEPMRYRRYRK